MQSHIAVYMRFISLAATASSSAPLLPHSHILLLIDVMLVSSMVAAVECCPSATLEPPGLPSSIVPSSSVEQAGLSLVSLLSESPSASGEE